MFRKITFSTRDLLALITLIALGMLPCLTWQKTRQQKARVMELQDEIKTLETIVRLDQPALHQAMRHTHDELEALEEMRIRSLAHFDGLREKYSAVEAHGEELLSIRGIPSLSADTGSAPVIFRLWVPAQRPVWLKFGVHLAQPSVHSSRSPDDETDLLASSPFEFSGPFEMRLQPGDQTLTIAVGSPHQDRHDSLPLLVTLGERVLVRSSFKSATVAGSSSSYISVPSQLDIGPEQKLPWLLTAHMNPREPEKEKTYAFSMWLSDHASNFKTFPDDGAPEQAETVVER